MQLINEMLDKAFNKTKETKGLVLHPDQGWQYQQYGYRKTLQEHYEYVAKRKLPG